MLVYQARMAVRIGHVDLALGCLISENDSTPFPLGRADLFSRFNITFHNQHKRIILTEI